MAAEKGVLGSCGDTCGGSPESDLARATELVARVEVSLGMGDILTTLPFPLPREKEQRLRHDTVAREKVEGVLREALERARGIIVMRRAEVEAVATCLEMSGTWPAAPTRLGVSLKS